jgi:hypothetical protein
VKKLVDELERLISVGNELREAGRAINMMPDRTREDYMASFTRWTGNCHSVLRFGGLSSYDEAFESKEREDAYQAWRCTQLVAVLQAAGDAVRGGFLGSIVRNVNAEVSESLLDQAEQVLTSGQRIAAGVLCRIVIERWIRDEAALHGIPNPDSDKASGLNDGLKRAGAFSQPKWRQVQAALDVGNSAAHGKDNEFTAEDVTRIIDFARANCF